MYSPAQRMHTVRSVTMICLPAFIELPPLLLHFYRFYHNLQLKSTHAALFRKKAALRMQGC